MATVVMFHAHPDDEAILTGGTIARLAAEGHRVVLVVATRGELGEEPPGLLAPGQRLAHRRSAETTWAAEILGIARVEFLDYRDSGMAGAESNWDRAAFWNADIGEAAERLASIVDSEAADVLVVYDDHGGYGHPDHVQVHRVGCRAAVLLPEVALYEVTMNRDHLRRGVEQLRALDAEVAAALPDMRGDFGEPEAVITHTIDVSAQAPLKRRAMAAHSSQIAENSFFLQLPDAAFVAGFGHEWFVERSKGRAERTVLDELSREATPRSEGLSARH